MSGRKLLDLDRAVQRPRVQLGLISEQGVADLRDAKLIAVERIQASPDNPRKTFREAALQELAESIRQHGILNPLTVRRQGDRYVLIAGERRLRAARSLGLVEVPCIVRDATDEMAYVQALVENLQRENIPPSEEARALEYLLRDRRISQRELARLIHKDVSYVSRRVRVYGDPVMREAVSSGEVPVSTAERLLVIQDPARRRAVMRQTIEERLTQQELRRRLNDELRPAARAVAVGLPNGSTMPMVGGALAGAALASGGDPVLIHGERFLAALQTARGEPDAAERMLLEMVLTALRARLSRRDGEPARDQ